MRQPTPAWAGAAKLLTASVLVCLGMALHGNDAEGGNIAVRSAENASIVVNPDAVIRDELPPALFGFNVHHYIFQDDLWWEDKHATDEKIVAALRFFPGALYRYPGGLVANRFFWEDAVGPVRERKVQKSVEWGGPRRVLFGPEEYLEFVRSVGGHPWYVLNLAGWDAESIQLELPGEIVDKSNVRLAQFMKSRLGAIDVPRYYQLGNELDRATFEWPHEKYIDRAKRTIDAMQDVDPDARFVAFLRDFDWVYKKGARKGDVSQYQQFIADVLNGLPRVNDFSLQYYYDDPGLTKDFKQLSWRFHHFQRVIDLMRGQRDGKAPNLWITEHARGVNLALGRPILRARVTSNLAASISTGDFLIGLAQIPEIKGAAWHGLNAGPWQLFDASVRYRDLRPRPVYWAMRVLRAMDLPVVLETNTASPNLSRYAGGYDIRAVAFTDTARNTLGLWAINRAAAPASVNLQFAAWKAESVEIRHFYLSGESGVDPDDERVTVDIELDPGLSHGEFSGSGSMQVELPPSSVSSFLINRVDSE